MCGMKEREKLQLHESHGQYMTVGAESDRAANRLESSSSCQTEQLVLWFLVTLRLNL